MKKRNIIVSAVLTIALCLGVIVGSTYALFTSDTTFNVAVTSATVDVVATPKTDYTVYSYDSDSTATDKLEEQTLVQDNRKYFANGGYVIISGNNITVDRMTPGDKFVFDVTVTNNSNVAVGVKPTVSFACSHSATGKCLSDVLVVTSSISYDNGTTWTEFDSGVDYKKVNADGNIAIIRVSVAFPITSSDPAIDHNDYQNVTGCDIIYNVNATQWNGVEVNP